jgi:O-antigen/teichoic acid export membrane protein
MPWHLVRRAIHRLGWGIADQGMSSLTNFLLAVYVARTLGAVQFGAFSLAYVTYGFALNVSRGLATDPLMVRFSGTYLPTWRRAVAACTGTAVIVGLVAGACASAAGLLLGGAAGMGFIALGLTMPGLLLQDSWRYSFFTLGRSHHAFINDAVWAAVLLPSLAFLQESGHASVFWFVFAWGATAAVGAAIGPVQARVVPSLAGAWEWLSRHRDLGSRFAAEGTTSSVGGQLRSYSAALLLGLAAVGYVQAANTLMGPFRIVVVGMTLMMLPEAARLPRRSPRHLPLFCVAAGAGLTLLGLAWGVVLLVAMPRGLGHLMLGSIWRPVYPLVLPATIANMGVCAAMSAGVGLHALGAARRSLRSEVISSALGVACAIVGAATGGALGMMWYMVAAGWLFTLVSWWQFRQALHEAEGSHIRRT